MVVLQAHSVSARCVNTPVTPGKLLLDADNADICWLVWQLCPLASQLCIVSNETRCTHVVYGTVDT